MVEARLREHQVAGIKSRPGRNSQLPASVSTGHLVLTLLVQYERNRFPATGSGTVPLARPSVRYYADGRCYGTWYIWYMVLSDITWQTGFCEI